MEKRELICVACPLGCPITVDIDENGNVTNVVGHTCKRGETYAHTEITNPTRMLTTTVRVEGGSAYVVPVKSANPIPKEMMFECMEIINNATVKAPVNIGDVVIENILGTGVDIIATNYAE